MLRKKSLDENWSLLNTEERLGKWLKCISEIMLFLGLRYITWSCTLFSTCRLTINRASVQRVFPSTDHAMHQRSFLSSLYFVHTFSSSVSEIWKENIPREWSSGLKENKMCKLMRSISQTFDWIVYIWSGMSTMPWKNIRFLVYLLFVLISLWVCVQKELC